MIYIGNIGQLNPVDFDEVWVICRSVKEIRDIFSKFQNVIHIPELAPSEELFKQYREYFHHGQWNKQVFDNVYVPRFLHDIQSDRGAINILRRLVDISSEKDIMIACFCEDEAICHRSIIAGILSNMKANIDCDIRYGEIYRIDL